jgi:membrane-associated protease RseP (regulator of RpoE activity)
MRTYILIAIMLLPVAAMAVADQNYDTYTDAYGYSSEDSGTNAYLGVDIADVTSDRLSALKLSKEQGVEVTMVDQDAPAGKAGIKEHDVILTMNGSAIESGAQLRRLIHETPSGRVVTLGISRNGQPLTIKAQLAERAKLPTGSSKSFHFEMPNMPQIPNMADMDIPVSVVVVHSALRSGLMVENLTPQLGDFFGAKDGHGVLVRSVEKGSRADKAGFRAGDVIVRVDKDPVHDSSDFSHSLQSHRGGPVAIGVIRDKREQTITLSLPERKQSGEVFGDEDFDLPDIEANIDLGDLSAQVAKLRPQMEYAIEHAMDEARKSMCEQQKQWREQQRKAGKEMRQQAQKMQQQWKRQQREVERELQQLQRSFDI